MRTSRQDTSPTQYCSNTDLERGYTIMEALIATAMFSAMVLLATMALNQGLKQYQGLMERGVNFWDNARHLWLMRSVSSSIDYYVYDDAGRWFPYFKGTRDGVSYISIAPLASDIPVVVWIEREKDAEGSEQLTYYEMPVFTKTYKDIDRDYIWGDYKKRTFLRLLSGVEAIEFNYYGFDIFKQDYTWTGEFHGGKTFLLPELVKITYKSSGKPHTILLSINSNSAMKGGQYEFMPKP